MERLMNRILVIGCLVMFLGLMAGSRNASGAEAPADFFQGKTLTWIVASDPGSPTDLVTRIIAPFLAKDIGAKIKVENKNSDEGVNYLYNQGSRDGLTLCMKTRDAMIGNEILKAPGVHYESDKFNYVSSVSPAFTMFQMSPKLPYKTLDGLKKAKGLRAGGTSAKGQIAIGSAVMLELLGLDGKVITGFKGKKELTLAIARGEIDFMVVSDITALRDEKDGYIVNLFAVGNQRSDAVPNVPTLSELGVKVSKEMTSAHKFISSSGTAVTLPPGVARERVEYLRKVFQTLSDNKELQKALERLTGDRRPFGSGQELQEEIAEIKSDKELANKLDAIFKKYTAVR
jgi:tripartite-type tricarboxylate transporter receptor subunit TctC